MERYLFIGGTRDGQRVAVKQADEDYGPANVLEVIEDGVYQNYYLHRFFGGTKVFRVYAIAGMYAQEVMEQLMLGYRR